MELQELVGSKVRIKERGGQEYSGRIAGVSEAVELDNIESSVNASTFRVEVDSGGIVETSGLNMTHIDHPGYIKQSAKTGGI